jgi:hypothetical protein
LSQKTRVFETPTKHLIMLSRGYFEAITAFFQKVVL